jgi:hypothetical protein
MKFHSNFSVDETFTQVMLALLGKSYMHIYVCNPWNQLAFALMNKIEGDQVWNEKEWQKYRIHNK